MTRSASLSAAFLAAVTAAACAPPSAGPAPGGDGATLRPFSSEAEYVAFNRRLAREYERRMADNPPPPPAPPPPPPAPPPAGAPAAAGESVTNVQHAGVDEGGIVKVHGDHLVVLRRGRLFTVRIGGDALQPVAAVDAFGPGIDPSGAWYDEMLISGDNVVVIGYSYARGGTELGLFRIGQDGSLAHRATYQLRSGDYYSSRNYASRLIGDRLIFYAPLRVHQDSEDPFASFPALRRWGGADTAFHPTASATRVYRPAGRVSLDDDLMLHTVTVCTLGGAELDCESTALFGPEGRVFYVSPTSVYVWATQYPTWDADEKETPRSVLYRLPLDGTAPTGLRVSGAPIDQFSFLESGDGHLNVLTATDASGEALWGSEFAGGRLALLRVPLRALGDGRRAADGSMYRLLPASYRRGASFQNRFVGDWLVYGMGAGWSRPAPDSAVAYAVRWAGPGLSPLPLPHGVDRIEAMGSGAVLIGGDGRDLHFSGVRLGADSARLAHRFTQTAASQGETRSHGFFYRPDGPDAGVLGLPIRGGAQPGYEHLRAGSAGVLFLRNADFRLTDMGALQAMPLTSADDGCRASCVDWYGNARPLFLRGRVFALMGYELVEGREADGRIREVRRATFAPGSAAGTR